jgi:polyhydroxyalkanoate synthase subunit PhaE
MDPFAYMRGLTELWGQGGKAFAAAQQSMLAELAQNAAKAPQGDAAGFPVPGADSGELAAANAAFAKLWSSASELSATITAGLQKGDTPDPIVTEMLGRIFDPRLWFTPTDDMDQALQRLSEGPRLADLWDVERKFLNVFNAWIALRRRSLEHNTVMLDAWMRAAGAFAKQLGELADTDKKIESPRELLTLWVETANEVMLETQRSDAFLNTQRDVMKASTELRLAQQEVAEFYSEMFGYPTRAELDDVHKTVTELRRELRALKRQVNKPQLRRQTAGGET